MFISKFYRNTDFESIKNFIQNNAFGIIVSNNESKNFATHIPLQWVEKAGKKYLLGHISKANIQKNTFVDGSEVLCIFSGAHTYISSSWYDHENVPTWNYMAAHVYGSIKIMTDSNEIYNMLDQLMQTYEKGQENPKKIEAISQDYLAEHLDGIVCFSVEIENIDCAFKLSQNRDTTNKHLIINALEKQNDDFSRAIASEIKKGL
jgi:transcriptional regulator